VSPGGAIALGRRAGASGARIVVMAALAAGCTTDAPAGATPATVTQSGDTTIIVPALDGPTGRLLSDLIIGADESNPNALFGRIADAAFGPGGEIYVVDSQSERVARFRPDGMFDGLLTRGGDGPGEVRSPVMLTVGEDGAVAVAGDSEIEWFSPAGGSLGAIAARDLLPPFRLVTSGRLLVHHGPVAPPDRAIWGVSSPDIGPRAVRAIEALVRGEVTPHWIEVLESDGFRADSVPGPVELDQLACPLIPDARGGRICIFVAYSPTTWFDWLPDGRRIDIRTDDYRLDISAATETPPVRIRPPRTPVPLEEEIAMIVAGTWNLSGGEALDTLFTPHEHKPAMSRIIPSRDGRIWVRLHAPSELSVDSDGDEIWLETESRFDIFTPEGAHAGHVTGPTEMWIRDIRGDTVLATRFGAYGVPRVERFTIDWSDPN